MKILNFTWLCRLTVFNFFKFRIRWVSYVVKCTPLNYFYIYDTPEIDIVFENQGVNEIGIDRKSGKKIVEVSKSFYRPTEVDQLIGDYTKIKNDLNWSPKTDLKNLIKIMIDDDY